MTFGFTSRRRKYPPGPKMNVFMKIKTLFQLAKAGKFPHTLSKWHDEYGSVVYFGVDLGPLYKGLMYSVADPDLAKEVFKKTAIFPARLKGGLTVFLPNSLLGIHENNAMWKKHRTILSKAFTDKYLKQYSEEIISVSNELIHELHSDNVIRNINKKMADITYRIVACTVLGKDFYSVYPTVGTKTQLDATLKSVIIMSLVPAYLTGFAPYFSSSVELANRHIQSQKTQIMNDIKNIRDNNIQGNSMLHFLVHHSADLSNDEIIDELMAFIVAGHETTANTLSFAMVCLSCNEDIQKKARSEIMNATKGEPLNFQVIEKLPFVRAILKETLRLFPTVPLTSRVPSQPAKLGPYDVDSNDKVSINIYKICRDPKVFSNPLKFQPDRWLAEDNTVREMKSYDSTHSFGGGLRVWVLFIVSFHVE